MKKIKRLVCIMLAVLVFVTAPLTTYMEANAVEVVIPTTMEIWEAILAMFGVSVGLGNQSGYFSQSSFDEFSTAVSNGHVYHMDNYGNVDFSSDDSVRDWLTWSNGINQYITSPGYVPVEEYEASIRKSALDIDRVSYKNTGTSATNAMHEYIDDLVSSFDVSGNGTISMNMREAFGFFSGAGDNDNDNDDKNSYRFKLLMAAISGAMLGGGLGSLSALKVAENSTFNDYDAAFDDVYFDGNFTMEDGKYSYYASTSSMSRGLDGKLYNSSMHSVYPYKVVGVINSGTCLFYCLPDGAFSLSSVRLNYVDDYMHNTFSGNNGISPPYSVNFPVYSDYNAALSALRADDFSGAENIVKNPYADFKNNAASAAARLGRYFRALLTAPGYLESFPNVIKPVLDVADTSAGQEDVLDALEGLLRDLVPDIPVDPDPLPVDPSPSTDYSGILGRILSAINNLVSGVNSLSTKMVNSFANKFMTADVLKHILTIDMPSLFAEAFASAIVLPLAPVINAIDALPDSISSSLALPDVIIKALEIVFPRVDELIDAVIAFPDVIVRALEGVVIEVPDIVIPEIVIPEIVIPEIVVPEITIPEVAVPDVNVELNPAYNITVANDFTGLGGIISAAVEAVLTKCFVPDEAATMEKFSEMEQFFKFKDDIIAAICDLKTMLFGITPSPILKIPIGKPTSKKYNYGTGSYIIIDVSWYDQYKQLGDKIVLAIAWALFLWRMFIKLPGIISGTEGSIVAADKAHNRYEYIKSSRKE